MKNCFQVLLAVTAWVAVSSVFAEGGDPAAEFSAAYKEGRPLAAERAFKAMLEKTTDLDPALYYQGAEVAERILKRDAVKDRMAQLLRVDKNWNERTAEAAALLAVNTGDVDAYARLLKANPKQVRLYGLGLANLRRFYDAKRPLDVIALADVMLGVYTERAQVDAILRFVDDSMTGQHPGFSYPKMLGLLRRHPATAKSTYYFYHLLTWNRKDVTFDDRVDIPLLHKALPERWYLDGPVGNDGIWNKAVCPGEASQIAAMKRLRPLEELIFASPSNAPVASLWLNWRTRLPGAFIDGKDAAATNAYAKANVALFRKLVAKQPLPGDVRRDIRNWSGRLGDPKGGCVDKATVDQLRSGYPDFFGHALEPLKNLTKQQERLVAIEKELRAIKKFEPKVTKLMEEALGIFKGKIFSADDEYRYTKDERLFKPVYDLYVRLACMDAAGAPDAVRLLLPRAGMNFDWYYIERAIDRCPQPRPWSDHAKARIAAMGWYDQLGNVRLPKGTKAVPPEYDILKGANESTAWNYFYYNAKEGCFAPEAMIAQVSRYLLAEGRSAYVPTHVWDALHYYLQPSVKTNSLAALVPWADLSRAWIENPRCRDFGMLRKMLEVAAGGGHGKEFCDRYLARLEKEDPVPRANELMFLLSMPAYVPDDALVPTATGRLLPTLKKIPNAEAPFVVIPGGWAFFSRLHDQKFEGGELYPEIVRLVAHGARGWTREALADVYKAPFLKAREAKDLPGLTAVAAHLGDSWWHWCGGSGTFAELGESLAADELWEPLFLLCDSLGSSDASMQAAATRLRGVAAPKLPGIYPVSEKDPAYPLYVAADELARHNPERAWDLLQKSVAVFERVAGKLPPDFTGWAVERLRMARGEKDVLLKKARDIATQLLSNEAALSPELAAAMMLVRAESYRDQQNFEAAKLEYQSIRNNPKYNATPSGKKAMFRAVGLMIDMGNASAAESTLEYWLSQPESDVQAEAHYFLARIAFERQDYEETIKQLRETFAIDFTHTEGRFLHGKWKLATNSEVDDTDVMIGTLEDRTVIRPGQQLTVTVQDRNLSVAGGGASIPVIVRTAPGGDVEEMQLYPSARDPNLFKGVIDVKLGAAACSNLILEVTGRDTASYVIDPVFLKARGLPITKGKALRVVDDAKLEIENEDLRPGNPIYVTVEDKDRSLGGASAVNVKVSTSSGDVLDAFALKETAPNTGKFKGEIPTSLPPPRAFASDTAAGFNPGDAINSTRSAPWKSVADGEPGKWIEVDTMASHLVREAKVAMKNPEEVREIALIGRLGTESIRLGSLPEEPVEKRVGLKFRSEARARLRSEDAIRARFGSMAANQYRMSTVTNAFAFVPRAVGLKRAEDETVWFSGAFVPPKDTSFIRLKCVASKTQGNTFGCLWMAVAVDGETVFQGHGPTLHNRIVSFDVTPGPHTLEVFASGRLAEDGFGLQLENEGEEAVAFPMDWFSAESHPELKDYLKSRAAVARTPEGFTATFERPMRLRSLRWEFLKRTTPDVTVDGLEVVNSKGAKVIPVTSDFSDAQQNDRLEVAPGDEIAVQYVDEVTTSGEKRILEKSIKSSFNNARAGFYFEELCKDPHVGMVLHCREAFRFRAGDNLLVGVFDPDMDVSSAADQLKARVTSSAGEQANVTLVEVTKDYPEFRRWEEDELKQREGVHSGMFLGLLRTVDAASATNAADKAMKVKAGESLTVSYMDRENTNPGVPFARTAKVQCTKKGTPAIQFFHTRKVREIDRSPWAMARLEKIRRRPGNEQVTELYREIQRAVPMARQLCSQTNAIDVNVATPIPVRVIDPTRACHVASKLRLEAVSESEIRKAKEEGREPEKVTISLVVGAPFRDINLKKGSESPQEARRNGSFNGVLELCLGAIDPERILEEDAPPQLAVTGSDTVRLRVLDDDGTPLLARTLRLVSNGALSLMDSTWAAERRAAHVGEPFYVQVDDADRDATDEPDKVRATAVSLTGGATNEIELVETLPHSGVFTGTLPTVRYGDRIAFSYADERTLPGTPARTLCVTGEVFAGSDGSVRLFSKRFRDTDTAVLVQFRLAECLFEQAKEHRKLKQPERSQEAFARGKYILEEALKNYPDSSHVVQGEYLLANLYQELGAEQKDAGEKEKATKLYSEALSRFSAILSAWPDSEYGAKAQFHKALCLEMLGDYPRASEEYVKMTYLYPDSDLVGDATIRLATYYYKHEKRYDVSGRIYENFQKRFPTHEKAARTLFMSGSCYVKQAEVEQKNFEEVTKKTHLCKRASDLYQDAAKAFASVAETYRESAPPEMRAQALYWAGDAYLRRGDYRNSYVFLKRTVFEYPETEWARRARGLILQESKAFDGLENQ